MEARADGSRTSGIRSGRRRCSYDTKYSLVEQSPQRPAGGGYPNADGFGLGWYRERDVPGLYRSIAPAWVSATCASWRQIESPIFLAHIRAATGTPIEQTNCHPFRHGRWLFMHNGFIDDYHRLRRDLLLAVDPSFSGGIEGTTDSELMFHLALSLGLEEEPLRALERMAGLVEDTGRRHGVAHPLQMTVAASNGEPSLRRPLREQACGQLAVRDLRRQRRPGAPPRGPEIPRAL